MELEPSNVKVSIICDDPDTGYTWTRLLKSRGMDVLLASSGVSGTRNEQDLADLTIIDETNTELNGIALIKQIKSVSGSLVLYLTSQNNEFHVLQAYQMGADECVIKPISPALFLCRVRALVRRSRTTVVTGHENIRTQEFLLEPYRRVVYPRSGEEIRLSVLEFRLLHLLITHPGRVFESEQIIHSVWGYSETGNMRLLKHLVFRLRQKIESDPRNPTCIKTERGMGYMFEEELEPGHHN